MNLTRRRTSLLVIAAVIVITASACQWPSLRGGPTNAAFNAEEDELSLADAGSVPVRFTADLGLDEDGWQTPVVVGSQIFAPMTDAIGAFDLNGVTGCSGTPKVCQPLWRGDIAGRQVATAATVVGTSVYVTAGNQSGPDAPRLYVFDARGETGCSGTPRWCQPLWVADGVGWAAPVVVGASLYVPMADGSIAAFAANGQTSCSGTPVVCTPLWRTAPQAVSSFNSPAVASGRVYAASFDGELLAYDASGTNGCSGVPKVCRPVWQGVTSGEPAYWPVAPVVAGNRVYSVLELTDDLGQPPPGSPRTIVNGFPLDGGTGCVPQGTFATPTCQPDWRADVPGTVGVNEVAAAYGSLFLQMTAANGDATLVAVDVADPACSPGPCGAAWTSATGHDGGMAAPIVANGTVYVDQAGAARALDAHGATGCSGSPRTCTAATFATYPDANTTGWSISNGVLVVVGNDQAAPTRHTLRVYG